MHDSHDTQLPDRAGIRGAQWRKRLDGLVPEEVEMRHVVVVGCGSVGSFMSAELVRSGVRHITLVDPDEVEWANLTRTVYGRADVGRKKVDALGGQLQAIFPDVEVRAVASPIQQMGGDIRALLHSADLVVAAVDQPSANGFIDRHCYAAGRPALFVGIYKGAKGGEVVVTVPERTPCFQCSTGGVRKVVDDTGVKNVARSDRDYGTNRLLAEVALGSDIHFVCSAATKIALSLLAAKSEVRPLAEFMGRQLDEGGNFLMLGMEPDYFLFPSTHEAAVGQYAFQSIWARTTRNIECVVCGAAEHREPPV